jgi:hypothetical protein
MIEEGETYPRAQGSCLGQDRVEIPAEEGISGSSVCRGLSSFCPGSPPTRRSYHFKVSVLSMERQRHARLLP